VFSAILSQEMAFFDEQSTGDLISRLTADVGEMANDLTWVFRWSLEAVVRVTGISLYLFFVRCESCRFVSFASWVSACLHRWWTVPRDSTHADLLRPTGGGLTWPRPQQTVTPHLHDCAALYTTLTCTPSRPRDALQRNA